ncbi:MAG: putative nuclease YbcO [Luteibacter sp.]|uniref:DUF1364 domain-containing protein n=1 Tax=Luteibacter sp. TaxID=1886636 RepID=UPI00137FDC9A|nr:DUF1364 domain-containing protein [Luteibacter sp.]KAF1006763.1 MAG: putative nuclease YbcO [Luteibacter sp.]
MKTTKHLSRKTPMRRGPALGRVASMGRADGGAKAVEAMTFPKRKVVKRSRPKMTAARRAAEGRPCMIRVPGICSHDVGTVVLCHYRLATGAGQKPDDEQGAWGCSRCHDAVDGRLKTIHTTTELRLWHAEGVLRTQEAIRREAA